jgi:diguanylate cyclase (GGDEF)-like protein
MCQVLLIDPDRKQATQLEGWLRRWGYPTECVTNASSAEAALERKDGPGIVIIDPRALLSSKEAILAQLSRVQTNRPVVVLAILDEQPRGPEGFHGNTRLELPMLGDALRPDDVLVRPLDARQTRIKMRSAEMLLNVQDQLAEAARAVQFLSSHDSLTRLVQRQAAMSDLKRETQRVLRTNSPMSIVLMDLDLFAQLNADAGHSVGDSVLREVGDRLRHTIRGYDGISRYGSDEFLILLPECHLEHAVGQAERIRTQILGPPFTASNGSIRLSACFALTESYGRHPDWVLKELEETLQIAKNRGPGSIVCANPMVNSNDRRPPATVTRGMALAPPLNPRDRVQ